MGGGGFLSLQGWLGVCFLLAIGAPYVAAQELHAEPLENEAMVDAPLIPVENPDNSAKQSGTADAVDKSPITRPGFIDEDLPDGERLGNNGKRLRHHNGKTRGRHHMNQMGDNSQRHGMGDDWGHMMGPDWPGMRGHPGYMRGLRGDMMMGPGGPMGFGFPGMMGFQPNGRMPEGKADFLGFEAGNRRPYRGHMSHMGRHSPGIVQRRGSLNGRGDPNSSEGAEFEGFPRESSRRVGIPMMTNGRKEMNGRPMGMEIINGRPMGVEMANGQTNEKPVGNKRQDMANPSPVNEQ